jgi:hypothetical protein
MTTPSHISRPWPQSAMVPTWMPRHLRRLGEAPGRASLGARMAAVADGASARVASTQASIVPRDSDPARRDDSMRDFEKSTDELASSPAAPKLEI